MVERRAERSLGMRVAQCCYEHHMTWACFIIVLQLSIVMPILFLEAM